MDAIEITLVLVGIAGLAIIGILLSRRLGQRAPLEEPKPVVTPDRSIPQTRGSRSQLQGTSNLTSSERVTCTFFMPINVARDAQFLIQAAIHAVGDLERARSAALAADPAAELRSQVQMGTRVQGGDTVEVRVNCDFLEIDRRSRAAVWMGEPSTLVFPARIRDGAPDRFVVEFLVLANGVPLGETACTVRIAPASMPGEPSLAAQTLSFYDKVFISYSSEDRPAALEHAMLMTRLGLTVFQDLLSLTPGERWERALYRHIDECDVFLLFWSTASAGSDWVRKEAEYALARQASHGKPSIIPIILEGPPPPAPPESLSGLHFNDPLRHIIAAEEAAKRVRG